jgi:hypothetical protein
MAGAPVRRIIYLNGVDTGLSAFSAGEAASKLARVLLRRGRLAVTEAALRQTHTTQKGRSDFTWPSPS